jgi:hypothetical protein
MGDIRDAAAADFLKILYIGTSGTGKTGSLISLIQAGYSLRIVDMDNGLDSLRVLIAKHCPDLPRGQVQSQSFKDKMRAGPAGPTLAGAPTAYVKAVKALDTWDDGTKPEAWGPKHILVLDSLTSFGRAAFFWARSMNPTSKEPRQWYYAAQDCVSDMIQMLVGDTMLTNVIVISHIDFRTSQDGLTKGFVSSIGKALGPKLPREFNHLISAEIRGSGHALQRKILTWPTAMLDLKTSDPWKVEKELPLETGLATLFKTLKG